MSGLARPLRLACYNVEWFDALFDDDSRLMIDNGPSGRHGVTRGAQIDALTHVFATLDADAVLVVEAPDCTDLRQGTVALERFAEHAGLRARRAVIGFANHTSQEIALLYDPERITPRHDPQESPEAPRFDGQLKIDLDVDAAPETVRWSKPPLELALQIDGRLEWRMIGVHAKSKAPHGARSPAQAMRISIANRRKQLAQCIWLRRRVAAHLGAQEPLIVLGDLNDGPGLDEYEALFGRSGVEIVLGGPDEIQLTEPHARRALSSRLAAPPTTARFRIVAEDRWLEALLDYIMVSPELAALGPRWRIWHPFDDMRCHGDAALRSALLAASDHFPVGIDFPV